MVGHHSSGQRPWEWEQHQGCAPQGSHMLGHGTRQPKTQRLQCSTTPRGPFPAAAAAGLAKNSRHRLLAATTVLNIASIDQAAGPAAQESRR